MRIFGANIRFHLEAKREPKWASYQSVQDLSTALNEAYGEIAAIKREQEAQRKKIYREEQKVEAAKVVEGGNGETPIQALPPGTILSAEQVRRIFGG